MQDTTQGQSCYSCLTTVYKPQQLRFHCQTMWTNSNVITTMPATVTQMSTSEVTCGKEE